jgi:hypothetical protein
MERHEVEAKAADLLAPVLGPERARALAAQVRQIERLTSVRALRPLLQAQRKIPEPRGLRRCSPEFGF